MNIDLEFDGTPTVEDSYNLQQLLLELEEADLDVRAKRAAKKAGEKDAGLMLGLALAGFALSAIGTVASVVSTWGSKRNYSISFERGGIRFSGNNLSAKDVRALAKSLKDESMAADIRILISRT